MTSGIYQIINKENGKIYIGSTLNFKIRFRMHKNDLRKGGHDNRHLQNAWSKYGEQSFEFCIVENMEGCPVKIIREKEQAILNSYIDKHEWGILYNIAKIVICESCVNSPETIQKRVASVKKFYEDPKNREKISINSKKLWQNPEYREKMRKIVNSEEVVAKQRESTTRRWQDPDYRSKLVAAHTGKITKDSTKAKLQKSSRKSGAGIREKKTGYYVHINLCNKQIHVGVFPTYDEALDARLKAEKHYWDNYDKSKELCHIYKTTTP